jgi:hypothetical protein
MWVGDQRHAPASLPRQRSGSYCTGGWMGPRPVWTSAGNFAPTGIRSPYRPARSESLYRLSYPGPRRLLDIYRQLPTCGWKMLPTSMRRWIKQDVREGGKDLPVDTVSYPSRIKTRQWRSLRPVWSYCIAHRRGVPAYEDWNSVPIIQKHHVFFHNVPFGSSLCKYLNEFFIVIDLSSVGLWGLGKKLHKWV